MTVKRFQSSSENGLIASAIAEVKFMRGGESLNSGWNLQPSPRKITALLLHINKIGVSSHLRKVKLDTRTGCLTEYREALWGGGRCHDFASQGA